MVNIIIMPRCGRDDLKSDCTATLQLTTLITRAREIYSDFRILSVILKLHEKSVGGRSALEGESVKDQQEVEVDVGEKEEEEAEDQKQGEKILLDEEKQIRQMTSLQHSIMS